jgi:asparagine synthase (glutamine-hydrolysing)
MSAIAAIFNTDGRPADPAMLRAMADAARDRGPDGAEYWTEDAAGLAFRKLATTAEAVSERQPWSNGDGTVRVILDGRIDNRKELARQLRSSGVGLKKPTDVELVGRCFELWGEETWERLLGDFAIVVWDGRKRMMLCARDPLGFKPLHYCFDGKKFLCGSELIQILQDPEIGRAPNEAFLAEFLAGGPYTREETAVGKVLRLEAGCCLAVDGSGIRKRTYYDAGSVEPVRFSSYDDCIAALRELLVEAVRCRMRAPGDVASHLSGGLDSSSIVSIGCYLSRLGLVGNRVEPFSLVFSDPIADEREYIAEVERAWGFSTHRCDPFEPDAEYYAQCVRGTFEMPRFPNSVMNERMDRAVGETGLRVCLSGHGGDHTMYGSSADLAALIAGLHPIRVLRALGALRSNIASGEVTGRFLGVLMRSGIRPLARSLVPRSVRRAFGRRGRPALAWRGWLAPSLEKRFSLRDRIAAARKEVESQTPAARIVFTSLRDGWLTYVVEGLERRAARAGFEYRYPFCDRRVIEFTIGLAEEQRWNQGVRRLLMRRAMKSLLPDKIRMRTDKATFDDTFVRVTRKITAALLSERLMLAEMGWVRADRFRRACDATWRLYEARNSKYTRYMWEIFALAGLEVWMRTLHGPAKSEPASVVPSRAKTPELAPAEPKRQGSPAIEGQTPQAPGQAHSGTGLDLRKAV